MGIDKLSSGSYRIRKQIDGVKYQIVVDHRPTKKEAEYLLAEVAKKPKTIKTLQEAAQAYIEDRRNVISPSTLRGYLKLVRGIPEAFRSVPIRDMVSADLQALANAYAPNKGHKTVKNFVCFIQSVLRDYDIVLRTPTIPQKETKEIYIPTEDDMRKIFDELRGSDYEVPITLAALGLRRSEILALSVDDLQGNVLTVNKACVQDENGVYVTKTTKTAASTRQIIIPAHIAELIREQGFVYNRYPSKMYYALQRACDACGVPRFPLHKLRHFFASYMHSLGLYTEAQIAELGGWSDGSRVMRQVYRHAMNLNEAAESMAANIDLLAQDQKSCHGCQEVVTGKTKSQ